MTNEMSASFRYLLFNYHQNNFKVKELKEDRLFSYRSIMNLDEVIEDFSMVGHCTKVPEITLMLVPSKRD